MPGELIFDPVRILSVLEAHGVDCLLVVGSPPKRMGLGGRRSTSTWCRARLTRTTNGVAAALQELNARLRVGGMTDEEAQQLPVVVAATLRSFGNSTWATDAGLVDVLIELRDRSGGRHAYAELATRQVANDIDGLVMRLAALGDIVASKEFAGRDKDLQALPELHRLQGRPSADG